MKQVVVVVTPMEFDGLAAMLLPQAFSVRSETHRWRVYPNLTGAEAKAFRDLNGASLAEIHVFPDIGDEGLIVMNWIRVQAEIKRRLARGER